MTGESMVKWAVRRYQPPEFRTIEEDGAQPLKPQGHSEAIYDDWRDVCIAMDTVLGAHSLQYGVVPTDPVVIKHGEYVVLIYMKLDF
jgi:hypothetical protein